MKEINLLFSRMDKWRHLPNYQLERRADLFFSLYMVEVLEKKLGFKIQSKLIPEFPVRIGTIYPNIPIDKSYKIDYLAISTSGDKAVFIELKTERKSIRSKQDKYLIASKETGLFNLLDGILKIFRATTSKRRYFNLLVELESLGLLKLNEEISRIMPQNSLLGINEESRNIQITTRVSDIYVIYIQPNGEGRGIISFDEFSSIVMTHKDPLSQRFAKSLIEWAEVKAGESNIIN